MSQKFRFLAPACVKDISRAVVTKTNYRFWWVPLRIFVCYSDLPWVKRNKVISESGSYKLIPYKYVLINNLFVLLEEKSFVKMSFSYKQRRVIEGRNSLKSWNHYHDLNVTCLAIACLRIEIECSMHFDFWDFKVSLSWNSLTWNVLAMKEKKLYKYKVHG